MTRYSRAKLYTNEKVPAIIHCYPYRVSKRCFHFKKNKKTEPQTGAEVFHFYVRFPSLKLRAFRFHGDVTDLRDLPLSFSFITSLVKPKF